MTTKNIFLSFQYNYYKIKNITKRQLTNIIKNLKERYIENQNEISELEGRLSKIMENDLKTELKNVRNFEKLNDKKITPYFMALAKQPNTSALLSDIRT
jgi:predicted RNase H-like nuclease (RuvC/YqgF family)